MILPYAVHTCAACCVLNSQCGGQVCIMISYGMRVESHLSLKYVDTILYDTHVRCGQLALMKRARAGVYVGIVRHATEPQLPIICTQVSYGMQQNVSYLKYVDTISTYRTPHARTEQVWAGMLGTSMNASRAFGV